MIMEGDKIMEKKEERGLISVTSMNLKSYLHSQPDSLSPKSLVWTL